MSFRRNFAVFKLLLIFLFFGFFSCRTVNNIPYFLDISDTSKPLSVHTSEYKELVIQKDDILAINIQTLDPQSTSSVNQSGSTSVLTTSPIANQQQYPGYLVDNAGQVSIPLIGNVKVVGLTTYQARDTIIKRVQQYYINPTVQVRFANFKITVIGEVARPASYTVPNEKVSILDAIGLAGDLTIFGRRENILLVRDSLGSKQFVRLNLNSSDIVKSPYFFLRQNDVIYVEPNKQKIIASDAARTRTITIGASVISVLVILLTRIK